MKRFFAVLTVLLAIFVLASCSSNFKEFVSDDGYTVSLPKSWKSYNTSTGLHAYVSNKDISSLSITVSNADGAASVADWWEANLDSITATFTNVSEIKTSNVIVDDSAAIRAEFTASIIFETSSESESSSESALTAMEESGEDSTESASLAEGERRYKLLEVHVYKEGMIYSIVFSADETKYEEHISEFEDIIDSFKFTEKSTDSFSPNTDGAPEGMQNAALKNTDYTVSIPLTWILTAGDGFVEAHRADDGTSVSVYSWELGSSLSLDEWWKLYETEVSPVAKNLTVIEKSDVKIDSEDAQHRIFTATVAGKEYTFSQYAVIHDYIIRIVTFTSSADTFELHTEEFSAIIETFKFKK